MRSESGGALPPPLRHITSHRPNGKSIFHTDMPTIVPAQPIRLDMDFYLAYTSSSFPANLNEEGDIENYRLFLEDTKTGLTVKGGTVLRICDFASGGPSPIMHRMVSSDYWNSTCG